MAPDSDRWVRPPDAPPLLSRIDPLLLRSADVPAVIADVTRRGATVRRIDLHGITDTLDLFQALRTVLIFPEWCGSGWDSFDDAFEEIATASAFPLFLIVDGLPALIERDPSFALHSVIRLHDVHLALARRQEPRQFEVLYTSDGWTAFDGAM